MTPPLRKRREDTPHGEPLERTLNDKEFRLVVKCLRCGRAKNQHRAFSLECPKGKRTRSGYTEFAAARFMGPDEIRALARELQEKAETETDATAALVLLRGATLFERLADLNERVPLTPHEDALLDRRYR